MPTSPCGIMRDHSPPKLSKPPTTNTSSSNLSTSARQSQESAAFTPFGTDDTDNYFSKMAGHGERKKRRDTIRSYLYGPSPESGHSHSSEEEESNPRTLAKVTQHGKRQLSRTGSSISQDMTTGGASAASSSSRLASGSDLSEDDLIKEQIKEKVWIDTLAAQNHVSSPIDEDKHPDSVKSPIRRRSLYTPGIATRSPDDILRKPPPPEHLKSQADRDYYYNPSIPDSSPLSRLAGLRSPQNGRSTPSQLDYGHLGALKLGTLRVTNGAASPVPREQRQIAASTLVTDATLQDDYYTPSEGGRSDEDSGLTMGRLTSDILRTSRHDLYSAEVSAAKTTTKPVAPPCNIELGHECSQRGGRKGSSTSVQSLTVIKRKPLPEASATVRCDRACSGTSRPSGLHTNLYAARNAVGFEHKTPTSQASPITNIEYTNHRPWQSPKREPESWNTFTTGADQPQANDGSREDAFLKLTANPNSQKRSNTAANTLQTSSHDASLGRQHVDSGYGSNISLGSTQRPSYLDLPAVSNMPAHTLSSSSRSLTGSGGTMPVQYSQSSNNVQEDRAFTAATTMFLDKPADFLVSEESGRSSLALDTKRASATSSQKQPASPEKSRRLQKKRPKSQPPLQRTPMAADANLSDSNIPPVPISVAALHSERVSKFPLLDSTYSGSPHPIREQVFTRPTSTAVQTPFAYPAPTFVSEESILQKLASKARSRSRSRPRPRKEQIPDHSDDESTKSDICRSPSWSEYGNTKKKKQRNREKAERELENVESATGSRSRSRSRFRSRSRRPSSQSEAVPSLADFGTVRESLGASPYDIAIAGRPSNHQPAGRHLQPYQVSTSKYGVDSSDPMPVRPSERSRTRSHTSATVPNGGNQSSEDIRLKPTRPYSMYTDQKPIPAMPMADFAQRESIQRNATNLSLARNVQIAANEPQVPSQVINPAMNDGYAADSDRKNELERASTCIPSAYTTDSMEELIDRLLDAPSLEAREITLEQIRQKRRRSATSSCGEAKGGRPTLPASIGAPRHSEDAPRLAIDQNTSSASSTRACPSTSKIEGFKATKLTVNDHTRHHSMLADAPPMPPIPTIESIHRQEETRSMERFARNKVLDPPQMQALEPAKSDLWAGCAIQTEHRKAIESRTDWDAHRSAWSCRRQSAGEALLHQGEKSGLASHPSCGDALREPEQAARISRALTASSEQLSVQSNKQKVFHRPWATPQGQEPHQGRCAAVNSNVAVAPQAFERRSGRYEGGLLYGYEPGFGLGGSAGTRSTKNGATRKSLQTSQGFGVDLSDVPIFVAPSK
ncbi:MAG: hypothetical protein L6R40_001934 [Gallowayella cf. fulva]|nr:MAG: hypothetical protein L6R40_001934 [Xanthomendoza cf. fulva]